MSWLYEIANPKRKIFVSYHHKNDQKYYNEFSRFFSKNYDIIYDHSLDRKIDSENMEYIKSVISGKYLKGSSCTIVLCGTETYKRKYVDWEIKATLDKGHGLIGVILPTITPFSILPKRLEDNIRSGYAILMEWYELDVITLQEKIEEAIRKPKNIIINQRPLMRSNVP